MPFPRSLAAWTLGLALMPMITLAQTAKIPTVTVAPATTAEVVAQVYVTGSLVARDEVLIFPQVSGFSIESLTVQVGDQVQAGDVLATLATGNLVVQQTTAKAELNRTVSAISQAQSQIATAQAGLTQAEAQLARVQALKDRGAATQADLDSVVAAAEQARAALASAKDGLAVAQAQRDQAQAQLDLADLNLEHARITAPVAGIISARNGQIGAIAASGGEPIYRLIAGGAVDVEGEVIETALAGLAIGNPVALDIASIGPVTGTVTRIAPTVDAANRMAKVTIEVPPQAGLRPGLFARGTIETLRHQALTIPAAAIQTDSAGTYVLRVTDGVVSHVPVTAGLLWQDAREVLSGLAEGDLVIARAGAFFSQGDAVNTITEGAAE
jgi:HlyD family secretion protein